MDTVSKELCNIKSLKKLDLGYFDKIVLPQDLYKLNNLRKLDIHNCKETNIKEIIGTLPESLTDLFISNINMGYIPDEISKLLRLENLAFIDCGIKDIPECIGQLKNLKGLLLVRNQIKTLPFIFDNMRFGLVIFGNPIPNDLVDKFRVQYPNVNVQFDVVSKQ